MQSFQKMYIWHVLGEIRPFCQEFSKYPNLQTIFEVSSLWKEVDAKLLASSQFLDRPLSFERTRARLSISPNGHTCGKHFEIGSLKWIWIDQTDTETVIEMLDNIWKCQTSQSTHSCAFRAQIMMCWGSSLIPVTRWFSWTGYLGNSRALGRWRCWLSQSTPTRQFLLLREPCYSCRNTKQRPEKYFYQKK